MADAPNTVDALFDELSDTYGITVPLQDLLVTDPYTGAMKNVTAGGYFGDEPVLGVRCKHIGFSTDRIDWQLWVTDGPQPLPRKVVITYKTEEQSPQWTAVFTHWELPDRVADLTFEFIPPRGAVEIPMISEKGKHNHEKHE